MRIGMKRYEPTTLEECPSGPFLFEYGSKSYLGFKSEYHTELPPGSLRYRPDAYVMESGEWFVGGAKSYDERDALIVTPIDLSVKDRA